MKKCTKCLIVKELSEFTYRNDTKKYRTACKECLLLLKAIYREKNRLKIRNSDRLRTRTKNVKKRKLASSESEIKLLPNEKCCDISGYDGLYKITSLGRIISYPNRSSVKFSIKSFFMSHGYPRVNLSKDGKINHFLIHRLVAIHFIPNPDNKPFINHVDANRLNHSIENLEWCTPKENAIHTIQIGRGIKIDSESMIKRMSIKRVNQFSIDGVFIREFESLSEAFRETGTLQTSISKCCKEKQLTANGFKWKYVY